MGNRQRAVTLGEYRRLLRRLDERTALAVRISANTGLRVSDVLGITLEQLSRKMTVYERKTGKSRVVRLPQSTYDYARAYARRNGIKTGLLIDCHRSTIYRHLRRAVDDLGLHHVSMHSLRKFYARKYARKHGARASQAELRHKYYSTTLLYLVDDSALEVLMDG